MLSQAMHHQQTLAVQQQIAQSLRGGLDTMMFTRKEPDIADPPKEGRPKNLKTASALSKLASDKIDENFQNNFSNQPTLSLVVNNAEVIKPRHTRRIKKKSPETALKTPVKPIEPAKKVPNPWSSGFVRPKNPDLFWLAGDYV